MSPRADLPPRIYHLALRYEWEEAARAGVAYRRSTLGTSLEDEGFIHCSFANQVQGVADVLFRGRSDVVLLTIDPVRVRAPIRIENVDGGKEVFPHVYGPLPLGAVIESKDVPVGADGSLAVNALLDDG